MRRLVITCLTFLGVVVLACVFAGVVAPYHPLTPDLSNILSGPSAAHWLGTDALGRDVLSRILYGGRTTLFGTLQAVVTYLAIGVLLGLIAGSIGGTAGRVVDAIVMWIADTVRLIPALITLLVVVAVLGPGRPGTMITFGVLASAGLVRVVRDAGVTARTEPSVAAAGLGWFPVLWRHIRPAVIRPVLAQVSLFAAVALLVETALGFLGLGVLPPADSWGNLIADAQPVISRQPWLLVPAGGIVALTCLAFTLLGLALRGARPGRARPPEPPASPASPAAARR